MPSLCWMEEEWNVVAVAILELLELFTVMVNKQQSSHSSSVHYCRAAVLQCRMRRFEGWRSSSLALEVCKLCNRNPHKQSNPKINFHPLLLESRIHQICSCVKNKTVKEWEKWMWFLIFNIENIYLADWREHRIVGGAFIFLVHADILITLYNI